MLASVPADYQPRAIAPHSEDQKGWKQDNHLKLPPQYEYVSLLYHSFLTKRYHTAVLNSCGRNCSQTVLVPAEGAGMLHSTGGKQIKEQ